MLLIWATMYENEAVVKTLLEHPEIDARYRNLFIYAQEYGYKGWSGC